LIGGCVYRYLLIPCVLFATLLDTYVQCSAGEAHWAFEPISRPDVPEVGGSEGAGREGAWSDWPRSEIDRFVLARLVSQNLGPASDAPPEALLRRLTYDLAGRPPTLAEQSALPAAGDLSAWTAVVDRLLSSMEFGERWAQHWLDVARFAESSGGGRSMMFPAAWRYRDYVIESYNNDLPLDQFILEQLAGDQLPSRTDAQRDRRTIATGFLTLGAINYELQDKQLLEMEIADEQIDAVGRAFLGLSLGCARCHDHKFDPIETEEYYGLAGIFTSTQSVIHENVGRPMTRPLTHGDEVARFQQARTELSELKTRLASLKKQQARSKDAGDSAALASQIKSLQDQIKRLTQEAPPEPVAMAVTDVATPADTHVRYGGDVHLLGPLVPRTFVSVGGLPETRAPGESGVRIAPNRSGRLELAQWIASRHNHLTARVYVNRIWHHLFGQGLVATPDDFGSTGARPTHPELLDYLATTFMENGWSTKRLVRRIVLSRVYGLTSETGGNLVTRDPANTLLGRARRRQLDGEAIRDTLLLVSGQLDESRGGLTIDKLATYDSGYQFVSRRRSVYTPRFRNVQPDVLAAFGRANPNTVTGCRATSILPAQALFLMNGPTVVEAARHTARRILACSTDDPARLDTLYRLALGRLPSPAEVDLAQRYFRQMRADFPPDGELSTAADEDVWSGFCQLVFGSLDFRYLN
jgi:hypothetical protein